MTPATAARPTPGARGHLAGPLRPGGRPRCSTRVLAGLVLAAVLSTRWVRLNVSGSLPYGLYRLAPVPPVLARGTLVLLPVPASVQHVWSRWMPLLKPVAAVAGDLVCNVDAELWIDGISYGPILDDAQGQPLPHIEGCQVLQEGEVFLASAAPRSLDSRYLGPVAVTDVTTTAHPVWVWQ